MDFTEYEIAVKKYKNSFSAKYFPLISWDIYITFFDTLKKALPDVFLLNKIAVENNWNSNWNFQKELTSDTVIVVTDSNLKIVFASKNIVEMNGYKPEEVIGNSPKMFQGKLTDSNVSKEISSAVKEQRPFSQIITNYCKDGSLYKCHINGYPVFDKSGRLINFIAFEKIAA
ncbi:PAS domain-containing protein [Flavobacterium dankookense]|uniref:PAS domain S-box-containing protein n=1 Tax=Flavobacterium dankookense TaxID=706186 RepID=A0A4R6QBV1_9FLAO|nr:PAS domain-containing protein [Flavobacterium dankookense]TDP60224.1 PAS domain S-box-containing protein [Flavobacterium dankookense]